MHHQGTCWLFSMNATVCWLKCKGLTSEKLAEKTIDRLSLHQANRVDWRTYQTSRVATAKANYFYGITSI